jgi:hypothetical protein
MAAQPTWLLLLLLLLLIMLLPAPAGTSNAGPPGWSGEEATDNCSADNAVKLLRPPSTASVS